MQPTLFIMSGLPGAGKSSLARLLAARYGAVYLRIDTIEQALRDLCGCQVQGEGYRTAYRIAADNLQLGRNVVADSCNPLELTRREWDAVAHDNGAAAVNIEIVCSDRREHRRRVETRSSDVAGLRLPSWADVCSREYHSWTGGRIVVDTSGRTVAESFDELTGKIPGPAAGPVTGP